MYKKIVSLCSCQPTREDQLNGVNARGRNDFAPTVGPCSVVTVVQRAGPGPILRDLEG